MSNEFEEVNLFEENNDEPEIKAVEDEVADPIDDSIEDPTPSFVVPDKFQGKSFEDVIDAYANLEKEMGRKANEVGELRKLTDEILKQQVGTQQHQPEHNEVQFDDFIDSPTEAVNRVLASDPRLKKIEESMAREAHEKAQAKLMAKHKDAENIIASPEFSQWVSQSPSRGRMLQEAHVNYDADLASDVLDLYKSTQKMTTDEAIAIRDNKASEGLKKAQVEKGTNSSPTKKMYSRSELIRLKLQDPKRYASMADEIRQAYADKRVK